MENKGEEKVYIESTSMPTKKGMLYERIMTSIPEIVFGDDEDENYGVIYQFIDKLEKENEMYRNKDGALEKLLCDNPEAAAAFEDFRCGVPLPIALRRYFDEEDFVIKECDPEYEEYIKAIDERKQHRATEKAREDLIRSNNQKSEVEFDDFTKEDSLKEEDIDRLLSFFKEVGSRWSEGYVTKDDWRKLKKMIVHIIVVLRA